MPSSLSDRPLLDTLTDAGLFVDRAAELATLGRAARQGLNALVVGSRGMGKTSLLRQLVFRLRVDGLAVVFVDARVAEDAASLLEAVNYEATVAFGLNSAVATSGHLVPHPGPDRLLELVRRLPVAGRERTLVVALDNVTSDLGRQVFGRLRDELWQRPVHWAVAVDELDRAGLMAPPANSFFDPVVLLGPLTFDACFQLVLAGLPAADRQVAMAAEPPSPGTELEPDERLRAIVEAGSGNPRELLSLARLVLLEDRDPAEELAAKAERARRLARLGRAATMLVAELEALGRPVSASDGQLLAAMGWTRGRAVQVLKSLEEAGLVEPLRGDDPRQVLYALRRVSA